MSTKDNAKFLKDFENFLEEATVSLGRVTKPRKRFIKEAMEKITNFINPAPKTNKKKVQIPNADNIVCFKPKNGNKKGGSYAMKPSDSYRVDEIRKGK